MTAQITLTRYTVSPNAVPLSNQHCWPITIIASGIGISSSIFVYRAAQKGDPFGGDGFSCVASVNQMYELPEDEGYVGTERQLPFFRRHKLELFCRSQSEADYIWKVVNEDVASLLDNFNMASALQGTETAVITPDSTTITQPTNMKTRIQLDYQPAGTATLVSGTQGVIDPDPTLSGWLPVTAAPGGWVVPNNAVFFYNIAQDSILQAHWPLPSPLDGSELYRNGLLLPYGIAYVITNDTIWWLAFDPAVLPRYERVGSVQDANAPWPTDYVNRNNLGAVSPQLVLMINS